MLCFTAGSGRALQAVLVLPRRKNLSDQSGRLRSERWPVLPFKKRSAQTSERLFTERLVLSQRRYLPEYPGRMSEEGWPVLRFTTRSDCAPEGLQAVLGLHQRHTRADDRGGGSGEGAAMLQYARRAQEHCPKTAQYWACRDLPTGMGVVQVTSADCQGGAQCYGSEQEAIAHCNPCYCCIKKPDGTYSIVYTTEADCSAKSGGIGSCHHTKEEAEQYCKPDQTWCCVYQGAGNGGLSFPANAQQCAAKGGHLYASEAEARKACRVVYCCFKDGWLESNEEACRQRGGTPYDSPQEANKACHGMLTALTPTPTPTVIPARCWSCVDGKVVQTTDIESRQRGIPCYGSEQEARAHCGEKLCWVCIDRNVVQMSAADAQARKLQCFTSKEDAQRSCNIEVPTWWCCIDGHVVQSTEAECRARGGQAFRSEQEARAHCGAGGGKLCWVCLDGKVTQLPETDARKRHMQCYRSEEEARAHCKEKTVWCCMDGQVVQMTEEECRARGGHAYRSEQEARRNCKGKTCWSCVNGKVVQLAEAQARTRGLPCFTSREEAAANCRPKEKETSCWSCINGRVAQIPQAQARARGLPCFGSREEAVRNCSGGAESGQGPNKPPQKRGRRR